MEQLFFVLLGVVIVWGAVMARRQFASFSGQTIDDYSDSSPDFDLRARLRGRMVCDGAIYGPTGRVSSTFTAQFDIRWDGDTGVMDELFVYNDGSTQNRQWTIVCGDDGRFTTTAPDVPRGGTGFQAGSAVQMLYDIRLPEASGGHLLRTQDWMYLTPGGVIVNRSQFRKFGIKVAELVATIRPAEDTA